MTPYVIVRSEQEAARVLGAAYAQACAYQGYTVMQALQSVERDRMRHGDMALFLAERHRLAVTTARTAAAQSGWVVANSIHHAISMMKPRVTVG